MKKREFKPEDFIPGNIDPKVMILKDDATFYNVLCTRILINPAQPLYPDIRKRVVVFKPHDYEAYFKNSAEKNIMFLHAMNFSEASLVWDPTLPSAKKVIEEVLKARQVVRDGDVELIKREGKRKATISDIEKSSK